MKQFQKAALKSMGYRPIAPDESKWAKPIGCNLLMFQADRLQLLFCGGDCEEVKGWNYIDIDMKKIPENRPDFFGGELRIAEHNLLSDGIGPTSLRDFTFLSAEENVLLQIY